MSLPSWIIVCDNQGSGYIDKDGNIVFNIKDAAIFQSKEEAQRFIFNHNRKKNWSVKKK